MICCIPSSGFCADERPGTPLALVPLPPHDGGVEGGGDAGGVDPVVGGVVVDGGAGSMVVVVVVPSGGRVIGGRVGGSVISIGSAAIEPTTRAVGAETGAQGRLAPGGTRKRSLARQ